MFKNFTPLAVSGPNLTPDWESSQFVPCSGQQSRSVGFIDAHTVMIETKTVPPAAISRRVDELAARIEQETGRKPGKKHRKELKEQALAELIVNAFPRRKRVSLMVLQTPDVLVIGSTSAAELESVVALVFAVTPELVLAPMPEPQRSLDSVLDATLRNYDPPQGFSIGRAASLHGADGKVIYKKHNLDSDEVSDHICHGKNVESLEMTFGETCSFTIQADYRFKGVKLTVPAGMDDRADADEAERFLWRCALTSLLLSVAGWLE